MSDLARDHLHDVTSALRWSDVPVFFSRSRFHDVEVMLHHYRGRVAHFQRDLTGILDHLHSIGAEAVTQGVPASRGPIAQ